MSTAPWLAEFDTARKRSDIKLIPSAFNFWLIILCERWICVCTHIAHEVCSFGSLSHCLCLFFVFFYIYCATLHHRNSLTLTHIDTHIAFLRLATVYYQIWALTGLDPVRAEVSLYRDRPWKLSIIPQTRICQTQMWDSKSDMFYHIRSQHAVSANHRLK